MKVGFIGCGNMGGALVRAAIKTVNAWQVAITDKDVKKAEAFADETGVIYEELPDLIDDCHYIFLGVKPQVLPELASELAPILKGRRKGFVIVSMLAGVTTDRLKELLGDYPMIRIMPNLPVSVGEGMVLYTATSDVTEKELDGFLSLMSESGKFIKLDEKLFDAGTSVSGCGPAFVCQFIEALTVGGVNCGLTPEDSRLLAEQTLFGTAKLLLDTRRDPSDLRVAVCSPGGSTIEGVKKLQADNIEKIVSDAVSASYKRNIELGK